MDARSFSSYNWRHYNGCRRQLDAAAGADQRQRRLQSHVTIDGVECVDGSTDAGYTTNDDGLHGHVVKNENRNDCADEDAGGEVTKGRCGIGQRHAVLGCNWCSDKGLAAR